MQLNFSFKNTKKSQPEKYPTIPVLTYIGGNKTQKFQLNNKAAEILEYNITGVLNFGKTSTDQLFIANTHGQEQNNKSNVFADKTFASSKFLDRLQKHFNITLVENQEFSLLTVNDDFGFPVLLISKESPNSMTRDDFSKFPDSEFKDIDEVSEDKYEDEVANAIF